MQGGALLDIWSGAGRLLARFKLRSSVDLVAILLFASPHAAGRLERPAGKALSCASAATRQINPPNFLCMRCKS